MSDKQKQQFNSMLYALKTIAKDYSTPKQLRKSSEKDFGIDYEEALEMAYENIQILAQKVTKGVKIIE